jgi:hypothetical protein
LLDVIFADLIFREIIHVVNHDLANNCIDLRLIQGPHQEVRVVLCDVYIVVVPLLLAWNKILKDYDSFRLLNPKPSHLIVALKAYI